MTTQTAAAQQCFRSRPLFKEKGSVVSEIHALEASF